MKNVGFSATSCFRQDSAGTPHKRRSVSFPPKRAHERRLGQEGDKVVPARLSRCGLQELVGAEPNEVGAAINRRSHIGFIVKGQSFGLRTKPDPMS